LPFGIMLGRLGNYLNQELYGIVVSKSLWNLSQPILSFLYKLHILHIYEQVDLQLRVNTNFLASFFEGFVLLLITMSIISKRVRTKVIQPGKIVAVFLVAYSFVRFCLEYVRADSQLEFHGRFTISQRFFILFFILWRGIWLWSYFQKKS
jgi:phosphatidylglycerol:prolipoprotein diacylglycerol transferase